MELFSEEVSLISDPGSLRSRRGNRKGMATKAEHHLLSLRDMELIGIDVEELETKLCYLQDAIEEYEVIQQHLEFVEGPDETVKHQDMVEAQRKSMLSIKKAVQRKIGLQSCCGDRSCFSRHEKGHEEYFLHVYQCSDPLNQLVLN